MRKSLRAGLAGVFLMTGLALGGELGISYVKTLGPNPPEAEVFQTLGGRLAVDEAGALYCGTPGGGSSLHKLTPEGRLVWNHFLNVPGFQGTAVDKEFLYTCGSGHYGYRQVQCRQRAGGAPDGGWSLQWTDATSVVNEVRPMGFPVALAVDERYLYVVDQRGHELRRLEKGTGKEAPFGKRVMVVEPVDLAWGDAGRLLILTAESVLETDRDGKPLRVPLVDGLSGAVALAYDPQEKRLYVAEGSAPDKPVNLIRVFDADGRPTGETIGVGGDFQGTWSPAGFAFNGGTGDVALDRQGGLWVNPGWDGKLPKLPVLTRFVRKDGKWSLERTLWALYGDGLAVDGQGNAYIGGQYKVSPEGRPLWTSGLSGGGRTKSVPGEFPATLVNWITYPAHGGGRLYIANHAARAVFALDPQTGEMVLSSQPVPMEKSHLLKPQYARDALYVGDSVGRLWRLDRDLKAPPEKVFGGESGASCTGLIVSDAADVAFAGVLREGKPHALRALNMDGTTRWEVAAGVPMAYYAGYLFVDAGRALEARRAADGGLVATVDATETEGRLPLTEIGGVAVAALNGEDRLYVLGNGQIRIYCLRRP